MKSHDSNTPEEDAVAKTLQQCRIKAPAHFLEQVMRALPARPELTFREKILSIWPSDGHWFMPAMAGAVAFALLMAVLVVFRPGPTTEEGVKVTFELQAPDAKSVELAGSFNDWQRGQLRLKGPDATGHWTATVTLPPGQHEYLFFVDGKNWVTDPQAIAHRADGFGNRNAILEL